MPVLRRLLLDELAPAPPRALRASGGQRARLLRLSQVLLTEGLPARAHPALPRRRDAAAAHAAALSWDGGQVRSEVTDGCGSLAVTVTDRERCCGSLDVVWLRGLPTSFDGGAVEQTQTATRTITDSAVKLSVLKPDGKCYANRRRPRFPAVHATQRAHCSAHDICKSCSALGWIRS